MAEAILYNSNLILIANIVTTSKALVTTSDAPVTSSEKTPLGLSDSTPISERSTSFQTQSAAVPLFLLARNKAGYKMKDTS